MRRSLLTTFGKLALAAGLLLGLTTPTDLGAEPRYDPGASDTEIRIGNTVPYSGPASAYGTIGRAAGAYFDKVNAEGGINGRRIVFLSYDDGYMPARTVEQTRKLVERDQVLLMFLGLGTPTQSAVHRYLDRRDVPQLFISSGASKWNDPERYPWSMPGLMSYRTEARLYARHALETVEAPRIGVLYQNDDFGRDYLGGLQAELGPRFDALMVAGQSYEVTDPTIDTQILTLRNSGANVFFNVTSSKFAAQAIRKAYDIGWRPLHFLSYGASSKEAVLVPAGLDKAAGVITVTVLKDPSDPQWANDPEIQAYRDFMAEYYPNGDPDDLYNLAGYAQAHALVHILEAAGDDLTRANIMAQARSMRGVRIPGLLPGITLNTGPDDHAPLEQAYLMRFNGERWEIMGDMIDLQYDAHAGAAE